MLREAEPIHVWKLIAMSMSIGLGQNVLCVMPHARHVQLRVFNVSPAIMGTFLQATYPAYALNNVIFLASLVLVILVNALLAHQITSQLKHYQGYARKHAIKAARHAVYQQ